jgi:hypothetical protein
VVADPVTFGARYILVPERGGLGDLNEINRVYPTMYDSGAGLGVLAHEFDGPGCPNFRLYRIKQATA